MRRTHTLRQFILPVLVAGAFFTACAKPSGTPAEDTEKEKLIAEYLAPVQEEANAYFAELAETAAGERPEEVRIDLQNADAESLKEPKSLSELLTEETPTLLVGFISAAEKGYSEAEIREIILETKNRELIVNLYFNYNDDYVYQVRRDGVVIDRATGKDGGAMREQIDYELGESEEEE